MSKDNKDENLKEEFINPIDKDKVAENPGTMPYAHTAGGAVIQPNEKGAIKNKSIQAMEAQTDKQMEQLYDQMKTLADQAKAIKERVEISRHIYDAEVGFEPIIGHIYYLYLKKNEKYQISLVRPDEWGKNPPYDYVSSVRLLADHTWEVVEEHIQEF